MAKNENFETYFLTTRWLKFFFVILYIFSALIPPVSIVAFAYILVLFWALVLPVRTLDMAYFVTNNKKKICSPKIRSREISSKQVFLHKMDDLFFGYKSHPFWKPG